MTALLLTFATFAAWWLIGLAVFATLRANLASLRVALVAPVLGSAATLLPLFVLSHAGIAMEDCAMPVTIALLVGSVAVLGARRPRLSPGIGPVVAVCIGALLLAGWPMLDFGFRWIGAATDDLANYALSATQLLHHGLLANLDASGLTHDRDYATTSIGLHRLGSRPGADITLAAFAKVTGRAPYEVFMPFILALHLCTICAAAALAMQATRRRWAAPLAAMLVAVSPLATYGVLQQFLPQVWGLGLAAALCALLMRPELHREPGPGISDFVPIGMLLAAMIAVYIELASTLALAYGLYLIVLTLRRQIDARAVTRLWVPAVGIAVIVLNTYLVREFRYVGSQARIGLNPSLYLSDFGFTLVPSALPGIVGLQLLPADASAPRFELRIAIGAVLLFGALVACLVTARRGAAASIVLVSYAAFGVLLAVNGSEFGLYKLYMYVQPFLAAAVAVWLFKIRRGSLFALAAVGLTLLMVGQLKTQRAYVAASRDPLGLHHASASDLLPTFRRFVAKAGGPVISVTENPTLAKLEGASIGTRPLYFISQDIFGQFVRATTTRHAGGFLGQWRQRWFSVLGSGAPRRNLFLDNTRASAALSANGCRIVLPSGSELALNRRYFPEGSTDLVTQPCNTSRNLLVFTASTLGQGFYGFTDRKAVSFYQLEPDFFYRGHTVVSAGRYVLFRILGPSDRVRMELNFTTTPRQDGSNRLPRAAVVGSTRVQQPVVGRGSARVFSPPLRPQTIDGQPYVLLDMGQDGQPASYNPHGLAGIYGRSVILDPRILTSFVRDVSLVSDAQYRRLRPPSELSHFPADLANPDLEYSGIYEEGWVAERSYVVLAGGGVADLLVDAVVPPTGAQHLEILVNGRRVASQRVAAGLLDLRLPVPASRIRRRVELRWATAAPLSRADLRPASALLRFLGFVPPGTHSPGSPSAPSASLGAPRALRRLPGDLGNPDLVYSGIFRDGWVEKDATVVLAGGAPANLVVRALAISLKGRQPQHLQVLVNGQTVVSRNVKPGSLDLEATVPASPSDRRIELRWAGTTRIAPNDPRRAAALLKFLGLVTPGRR